MPLTNRGNIRILFYTPQWSILGWFIRLVTRSRYTHVDIELEGVGYEICLMDGALLYPKGIPVTPSEVLEIPEASDMDLEFPSIVLNQRIDFWESFRYHVLRWCSMRYRLVTPVTNCVTMVNIILNHNLDTNWFNGYTPDDLYDQTKRYLAHREQRASGVPSEEDSKDSLLLR